MNIIIRKVGMGYVDSDVLSQIIREALAQMGYDNVQIRIHHYGTHMTPSYQKFVDQQRNDYRR